MYICLRDLIREINKMIPGVSLEGFDYFQLNEIYWGLKEELNIKWYFDTRYNSTQMQQIRLGLKANVDVSIYADVDIPDHRMLEIRKLLESELSK